MSDFLAIRDLTIALPSGSDRACALDKLNLRIGRGEIVCLVGESGSGKSVLGGAISGLLPRDTLAITAGSVRFDGTELTTLPERAFRLLRGKRIGMIFQEPMTALNPVLRVGDQIDEVLKAHGTLDRKQRLARILELARAIRLPNPEELLRRFPHQLSGGQRQRVMIAIAIANEPDLLIADEPTTALDVTTQAEILKLILDIRARLGLAVLFITHDFGVVSEIADRVAVLEKGVLVEEGPAHQVLGKPRHAYTRRLIAAVPRLDTALRPRPAATETLLVATAVSRTYPGRRSLFGGRHAATPALDGVSLTIGRSETVALVGESGSGKTTLGHCIAGLMEWDGGEIRYENHDLRNIGRDRGLRSRIQMVFQDPYGSLNPRHRIRRALTEAPITQGLPRKQAEQRMFDLLERVGLDPTAADRFPHAFSGGQRQRLGLARALMTNPSLLVADEPVSALDVSIQAQVLDLLAELRNELGLAMLFITHDLRVASALADRIAVMQSGRIVEIGRPDQILSAPRSAYARKLLGSIPGLSAEQYLAAS
jgi:peptide/nickel transport system ATP-binding protein